jgi:hypothetical protein
MSADMTEAKPLDRRIFPAIFLLAAAVSFGAGVPTLVHGACPTCSGLLSFVLPWAGLLVYSGLALLSWRSPRSPVLAHALGFLVFAHACLVTEAVLLGRICIPCAAVAGTALLAAGLQAWKAPETRITLASGLLLGAVAGFFYPFDRVEDALTRRFWPARILEQAPAFVDRKELADCGDGRPVRLLVYEDERSCQSCSGLGKRLLPLLDRDFPADLCVHKHVLAASPGQTLPVLVLLSKRNRLIVYEGVPVYEDLRDLIRSLCAESGVRPP